MCKRLLTIWIIFSTLGYGAAWAFDIHAAQVDAHHSTSHQISTTDSIPADDGNDSTSCSHCCHASAHLLALRICPAETSIPTLHNLAPPYRQALLSAPSSPLERPPRS